MRELEGKDVVLFCANYIYSGTLVSIGHDVVALRDACIVYETGEFSADRWKDAQRLPTDVHYIERSAVESFGAVVRKGVEAMKVTHCLFQECADNRREARELEERAEKAEARASLLDRENDVLTKALQRAEEMRDKADARVRELAAISDAMCSCGCSIISGGR